MKLIRSGENEYRIEGLDRETLRDIATALLAMSVKPTKKVTMALDLSQLLR